MDSVQYVTDQQGRKKGVLVDLNTWQELVQLVEPQIRRSTQSKELSDADEVTRNEAEQATAMLREEAAFRRLHPSLYKGYAGKYVAIHNEQLVDSDVDQVALYRRVRKQHPGKFVWIAPVDESPEEVLVFRSPRFVNGQS